MIRTINAEKHRNNFASILLRRRIPKMRTRKVAAKAQTIRILETDSGEDGFRIRAVREGAL